MGNLKARLDKLEEDSPPGKDFNIRVRIIGTEFINGERVEKEIEFPDSELIASSWAPYGNDGSSRMRIVAPAEWWGPTVPKSCEDGSKSND